MISFTMIHLFKPLFILAIVVSLAYIADVIIRAIQRRGR